MASDSFNIDFFDPNEVKNWSVTNDTVMGGVSSSFVELINQKLRFSGVLRLENNGGFTSVYRRNDSLGFDSNLPINIRVKGDGRSYQLRFRMPSTYNISYAAPFSTTDNQWIEHQFTSADFKAVFRGRSVLDAPPLDFSETNQIGFLLADKRPGEFVLMVEKIYQRAD